MQEELTMVPLLSRLPGERNMNPATDEQHQFAAKVNGEIKPGCFSQCQVITKTHVYLITRAGIVRFSSKRSKRGKS